MRHLLPALALAALAAGSLWSVGYASAPRAGAAYQSAASTAADNTGLTVIGRGEYTVTAARAEIRLELKESDEMAGAALQKLIASGLRLEAAMAGIESGTVTVERSGPRFRAEQAATMQMIVMGGMDSNDNEPPKVEVLESFVLSASAPTNGISLAALVAEVLEAAGDAGATMAADAQDPQMMMISAMMGNEQEKSEPAVTFYPADDKGRQAAMVVALEDATAEARALAQMARRNLGTIEGLRAIGSPSASLSGAGTERHTVAFEVRFGFQ